MASIIKANELQDFNGNAIITSDGSGNVTVNAAAMKMTPAFEAYLSSSQSVTNSSNVKAQIDTEVFDTDNAYDNSTNYRFTPQVAGKYFVYGAIRGYAGNNNDLDRVKAMIYKNGSEYRQSMSDSGSTSTAHIDTEQVSAIIDFNGSSDYVELYGLVEADDGSGAEFNDGTKSNYFGAFKLNI